MRGSSKKAADQRAKQFRGRYQVYVDASLPVIHGQGPRAEVIDLWTGRSVYHGPEEVCISYARQWESGNPQQYLALEQLASALLERQARDHPLPWRFESNQLGGANIISHDDYIVVTVDSAETAEWIVRLANESGS